MASVYRPVSTVSHLDWSVVGVDRAKLTSQPRLAADDFAIALSDDDSNTFVRAEVQNGGATFVVVLAPAAGGAAPGNLPVRVQLSIVATQVTDLSDPSVKLFCHNEGTVVILGKNSCPLASWPFNAPGPTPSGEMPPPVKVGGDVNFSQDDLANLRLSVTANAVGGKYRFEVYEVSVTVG